MSESEWTKILGWPGYRVYRSEINEDSKTVRLWVRRKRGNRKLVCSGCGQAVKEIVEVYEREVRDLPCFEYRTTVVIELYRVRCPGCGIKAEKVPLLPSKARFSKRFEEAVGQACESAPVRTSGPAVWPGGEHGASDRYAVSRALGPGATPTHIAADGSR